MEDERLAVINAEKEKALQKNEQIYGGLLDEAKGLYDQNIDYANEYEKAQNEMLDRQLNYNLSEIERQRAKQDELYADETVKSKNAYEQFINPYGVNQEATVKGGLNNSGYSESVQGTGFNAYMNRNAVAKSALMDAYSSFDSEINEARLNNDVLKAQNALAKLEMTINFANDYFSNKSNLTQSQLGNEQNLSSDYASRLQNMLAQIQSEKQLEEEIRQYNEQMAYQKEQDKIAQEQWQKQYNLSKASASRAGSSGGSDSILEESVDNNKINSAIQTLSAVYNSTYKLNATAGDKKADTFARNAQKVMLQQLYNKGQISKNEFIQIAQKYKF